MKASSLTISPLKFRFDRQLWRRFVEVAQPYFFPPGARSSRQFLLLICTQIVFVISLSFFLTIAIALIGFQLAPKFFAELVREIVYLRFISGLGNSSIGIWQNLLTFVPAYLFLLLLCLSSGIFYAYRRKLRGRERQWSMLALLIFLAFIVSSLNVLLSYIFRFIDNSLHHRDPQIFWQFIWVYGLTLVIAIPILIGYRYARRKLALLWRKWLTEMLLTGYFNNRAYYELDSNAANTDIDNPDQRITQDANSFTTAILDFILDILSSILDLIAFAGILYSISTELTLGLVGYIAIGSILALWIGTKLIKINFHQLRLEGDFRYGMVRIRDYAESIAFYRGEQLERDRIELRLGKAIRNADLLIIWFALLDIFQYAYKYCARLVPYLIITPLYFSNQIDFGTITQGIFAFQMVLDALSIIPTRIQDISAFAASIERLGMLHERLTKPESHSIDNHSRIQTFAADAFKVDRLTLNTPNSERTLFSNLCFELSAAQSLLVVGASGCGKSSLLRALAGLWRNGKGAIFSPDWQQVLFLPQQPYMVLGTLREQVKYPNLRQDITDSDIKSALAVVNLQDLPTRMGGLDREADWASVLSQGEQQRLAFARILLARPQFVILDEATSALDIANERRLYELLQLQNIAYISVGHRPSLLDYHRQVLDLSAEVGEGWQLLSAQDYRFAS